LAESFTLVVGPSGSGKTTLLWLISGLGDGAQPSVFVKGHIDFRAAERRNNESLHAYQRLALAALQKLQHGIDFGESDKEHPSVGMVFQELALFDELTAVENVRFALDHASGGLGRYAPAAATGGMASRGRRTDVELAANRRGSPVLLSMAEEWLERVGVRADARMETLSGGERQRVAVARTLATDAPILLFDEPTTGLDPIRAREIADLIAETNRSMGKTVIVVTHDYGPFLRYSPRILLLDPEMAVIREVTAGELQAYFDRPSSFAVAAGGGPLAGGSRRGRVTPEESARAEGRGSEVEDAGGAEGGAEISKREAAFAGGDAVGEGGSARAEARGSQTEFARAEARGSECAGASARAEARGSECVETSARAEAGGSECAGASARAEARGSECAGASARAEARGSGGESARGDSARAGARGSESAGASARAEAREIGRAHV